jgi:hypothetical protein
MELLFDHSTKSLTEILRKQRHTKQHSDTCELTSPRRPPFRRATEMVGPNSKFFLPRGSDIRIPLLTDLGHSLPYGHSRGLPCLDSREPSPSSNPVAAFCCWARWRRSPGKPDSPQNRTHQRAAQRVSLFVCELRHITLPGIDLVCRRFLPRLGPVANGGFLLRGAGLLNSLSETHDQGRL